MFGYIKPFKPELKMREFDTYKAMYCGLCHQLGKSYGGIARLTLSYDFTFLFMLRASLSSEKTAFTRRGCCVNPLKQVRMCNYDNCADHTGNESAAYSADIAAIMIYYKLMDNLRDSGPLTRGAWGTLYPLAKSAWKKASAARPDANEIVAASMERQQELENSRCPSPDEACEPSASVMAGLFASLSENASQKRVLERMGYLLGRYVYLCDALDDLEDDQKSGSYNPFLLKYNVPKGKNALAQIHANTGCTIRSCILADAKSSLFLTTGEIAKACDLLNLCEFDTIIINITHLGLRAGVEEILSRKGDAR